MYLQQYVLRLLLRLRNNYQNKKKVEINIVYNKIDTTVPRKNTKVINTSRLLTNLEIIFFSVQSLFTELHVAVGTRLLN